MLDLPLTPTASKPALDLAPGDAIHVPGLGRFAISAPPHQISRTEVLLRLGFGRLALIVAPDATFEAICPDPPTTWRHHDCHTCGGTGRYHPARH
jgi:hypothetical protein